MCGAGSAARAALDGAVSAGSAAPDLPRGRGGLRASSVCLSVRLRPACRCPSAGAGETRDCFVHLPCHSPGRSAAWTRGAARSSPSGPRDPRGSRRPDGPRPVPSSCRLSGAVLVSPRLKTGSPGRRVLGVKTCSFSTLSVCPPVARWPRGLRGAAASGSGAPPRWCRPDSPRVRPGRGRRLWGCGAQAAGRAGCSRVRVGARRAGVREEFGEALADELVEIPFCLFVLPPSSTAVSAGARAGGSQVAGPVLLSCSLRFLPHRPAARGPPFCTFLRLPRKAQPRSQGILSLSHLVQLQNLFAFYFIFF